MTFYGQTVAEAQSLAAARVTAAAHIDAARAAMSASDFTLAIQELEKEKIAVPAISIVSNSEGIVWSAWFVALVMSISNVINGIKDHILDDKPVLRVLKRA